LQDVALFVIDGREGVTSLDRFFSKWLRRQCRTTVRHVDAHGVVSHVTTKKPVILIANKCDNHEQEHLYFGLTEGYELGFGEPVPISADHSSGMSGLHNALYDTFLTVHDVKAAAFPAREKAINAELAGLANLHEVKLAIVGKVNVGKSTLINTLLGETRVLTGSQPGVTRDPIEIEWRDEKEEKKELKRRIEAQKVKDQEAALQKTGFDGKPAQLTASTSTSNNLTVAAPTATIPSYRFTLVDTAGLKGVTHHAHSKYSRVDELSMTWSLRSIERANVVALIVDISDAGLDGVAKPVADDSHAAKKRAAKLAAMPQPLTPTPAAALAAASTPTIHTGLLFKEGKKYTEEERGHLLRTFVRNVFSSDDLAIAAKILSEGRALVILLNKFDLVPTPELRDQILEGVAKELESALSMAGSGVTVLGISGAKSYDSLRGQPLKTTIRAAATRAFERWSARVPTHRLNQWLIELLKFHPPPSAPSTPGTAPRRIALKFIQQVSTRPPTFVLFANRPAEDLPEEYKRFLINALRKEFDLGGVAVRLHVRVRKNPYNDPASRVAARAKSKVVDDATVPSFADEDAAEVEFDEADYSPLDKEVQFDYDAAMPETVTTKEGQEEIRREQQARGRSAAPAPAPAAPTAAAPKRGAKSPPIVDSPIPRVTQPRRPRVNTSNIFASTRTVSKPRRSTQPAFRWSLQQPRAGSGAPKNFAASRAMNANGWLPTESPHKKPFGTRRPKKDKAARADKNVQSKSVLKTVSKADASDKARKEAAKHRKLVAKSTKAAMKR
jgi:small GTP-binding protein